jgi:SNF2 family DNA or RNA helicase
MGLGKTLQALMLLQHVVRENDTMDKKQPVKPASGQLLLFDNNDNSFARTSLIVVPTSLVHNWLAECRRFTPHLRVASYIGVQRKSLSQLVGNFDVVVTSYGIVRNDLEKFLKHAFLYVILDESQAIKNPGSKSYQAVTKLRAEYRIVLTGTPVENTLMDLWAQLNFLNPGLLGNLHFFKNEFQVPIERFNDEQKQNRLKQLIAPFIMRRSKTEVAKELPPVSQQYIYCDMHESQARIYESEKSKVRNEILENIHQLGLEKSAILILQSLTRLRQIASHPVLVDKKYVSGSGKFDEVMQYINNVVAEGHKALLFSSFVKHLKLYRKHFENKNIPFSYLTGETVNREAEIKKFQESDTIKFFLISLKAGGVGLNLTAADYVFLLDPWWNPAVEMQAINRAHRIGQDKHVFVYRFIASDTLEEKIVKLQQKKSALADMFVNNNLGNVSKEEILALFD